MSNTIAIFVYLTAAGVPAGAPFVVDTVTTAAECERQAQDRKAEARYVQTAHEHGLSQVKFVRIICQEMPKWQRAR